MTFILPVKIVEIIFDKLVKFCRSIQDLSFVDENIRRYLTCVQFKELNGTGINAVFGFLARMNFLS